MSRALDSLASLRRETPRNWSTHLPGSDLAERLNTLGREAWAAFEEQDVPSRRLESWKGTNFARLEAMAFVQVGAGTTSSPTTRADASQDVDESADLVFVDGHLRPASPARDDLPAGVRVLSLAEAASESPELLEAHLAFLPDVKREPLAALQTAFFEDVAVVQIEEGVEAPRPLRIRSIASASSESSPRAYFPRLLVVAGKQCAATILFESSDLGGPGLTALVAEFHLDEGARIEVVQVQGETSERIHFTSAHARLEAHAQFDSHVFSLAGGLVRSELAVTLAGAGAETRMRGFFLGRGKAHVDHFTTVDHVADHCTSDQEYRGVLGDDSKGVFRGRVIVRPGAQKTDAKQSNPNLLLSNRASIDTKPQLEIYANDIRASHGSTIGQLDADALFFLRARGISESVARLVLTQAFARSIVDGIKDTSIRETVSNRVEAALASLETGAQNGLAPGGRE